MTDARIPVPSETWTVARLLLLGGTVVYGWRRGAQYLYVGRSHQGALRILDASHAGVRRGGSLLPTDEIDFWRVPDGMIPSELESLLIDTLRPLYAGVGRQCVQCRRHFQTERAGQKYCTPVCRTFALKGRVARQAILDRREGDPQ